MRRALSVMEMPVRSRFTPAGWFARLDFVHTLERVLLALIFQAKKRAGSPRYQLRCA